MTIATGPARTAGLPAFDRLLEEHGPEIYRYLRRQVALAEDAADLHQETFLRAFRAYGRLTPDANVRAWLYRIAGNLATDHHRRRRVAATRIAGSVDRTDPDDDAPRTTPADAGAGPEGVAQARELTGAVRTAIVGLSPRQRAAVALRVFDGRSYQEVAEILDCSEESARQHVSQGLRRLRSALEAWR